LRAAITTSAPRFANPRLISKPMPALPPVTTASLPSSAGASGHRGVRARCRQIALAKRIGNTRAGVLARSAYSFIASHLGACGQALQRARANDRVHGAEPLISLK
jgi:hypothetical protein